MNYEQLLNQFNEQKQQLQGNESVNLCAHRYLAYGLDCIEYFAHNYKIVLDSNSQSFEIMDLFVHQIYAAYQEEAFDIEPLSEMIAGYLSLVLDEFFHGQWVYDEESEAYEIQTHHYYLKEDIMALITRDEKFSDYLKISKVFLM